MKFFIAVVLCALDAFGQERPNTLTPEETAQGWKLLFDGKSLKGWESHGEPEAWSVKDGALACRGTMISWLGSVDAFSDFTLKLEFRGAANVNSGVFLRSNKEGQPHLTGYELQIWDFQPAGYNTGSFVGTAKASPVKILADRWNRYEVTADGDRFVVVLNGQTVLDIRDKKSAAGVFGLQCQKDLPIDFRNFKVKVK